MSDQRVNDEDKEVISKMISYNQFGELVGLPPSPLYTRYCLGISEAARMRRRVQRLNVNLIKLER